MNYLELKGQSLAPQALNGEDLRQKRGIQSLAHRRVVVAVKTVQAVMSVGEKECSDSLSVLLVRRHVVNENWEMQ